MQAEYMCLGQIVPEWATGIDGCVMEYHTVSGFTLLYFMNKPTPLEKLIFNQMVSFKITFTSIVDIGFFCFKVGDLPWSDCVFSPNIYTEVPQFDAVEPNKGYALNLILVDSAEGKIQSLRQIGLGSEFSAKLREWCLESLRKNIRQEQYQKTVNMVHKRFSTQELVDRAWLRWTL